MVIVVYNLVSYGTDLNTWQKTYALMIGSLALLRCLSLGFQCKQAIHRRIKVSLVLAVFMPTLKYHLIRIGRRTELNIKWLLTIDFIFLVLETACLCVAAITSLVTPSNLEIIPEIGLAVDLSLVWPALTKLNHQWLLERFVLVNAPRHPQQPN